MAIHIPPEPASPSYTLRNSVAQVLSGMDQPWQQLRGGRVNALWRVGDTVIKQFRMAGASPLFPNDPSAETVALSLLAAHGLAPNLLAYGQDWIAYQYCPGAAWSMDTTLVATALSALYQITVPSTAFRSGANGSTQLLTQAKAIAALCRATLPPMPQDRGIAKGPTCLIHGDVVPGNLIAHNGKITFIDWQCPAIGDPAEDVATFLSPAMQYLYRGAPLPAEEIRAFRAACAPQVIDRYDQLAEVYHWRMAAHCLWKSENNAPDYAQALKLELDASERLTQQNAD